MILPELTVDNSYRKLLSELFYLRTRCGVLEFNPMKGTGEWLLVAPKTLGWHCWCGNLVTTLSSDEAILTLSIKHWKLTLTFRCQIFCPNCTWTLARNHWQIWLNGCIPWKVIIWWHRLHAETPRNNCLTLNRSQKHRNKQENKISLYTHARGRGELLVIFFLL